MLKNHYAIYQKKLQLKPHTILAGNKFHTLSLTIQVSNTSLLNNFIIIISVTSTAQVKKLINAIIIVLIN